MITLSFNKKNLAVKKFSNSLLLAIGLLAVGENSAQAGNFIPPRTIFFGHSPTAFEFVLFHGPISGSAEHRVRAPRNPDWNVLVSIGEVPSVLGQPAKIVVDITSQHLTNPDGVFETAPSINLGNLSLDTDTVNFVVGPNPPLPPPFLFPLADIDQEPHPFLRGHFDNWRAELPFVVAQDGLNITGYGLRIIGTHCIENGLPEQQIQQIEPCPVIPPLEQFTIPEPSSTISLFTVSIIGMRFLSKANKNQKRNKNL